MLLLGPICWYLHWTPRNWNCCHQCSHSPETGLLLAVSDAVQTGVPLSAQSFAVFASSSGMGALLSPQGSAVLILGAFRSGLLLPACDLAMSGLLLFLRGSIQLDLLMSTVMFSHPDALVSTKSLLRCGLILSMFGKFCPGPSILVLDFSNLGAILFVKSISQVGLFLPILGRVQLGLVPLIFNSFQLGSLLLLHGCIQAEFPLPLFSLQRLGSLLLALDSLHPGFLLFPPQLCTN